MAALNGTIVLVTGASRGAGRGIALELGAAGATVYVTGRSVSGAPTTDNVAGTIDATAEEITRRGGRGIPIRCDHTDDLQVQAVFDRIRGEQGRLDLLVNNVWGGYENPTPGPLPMIPFWEQPIEQWDRMFAAGVRAHLVASRLAVPLMLPQRRGLIVCTTAHLDPLPYFPNIFYDVAKTAVARLIRDMGLELKEHGITAIAVAPGFMRTERVVEAFRRAGAEAALDGPGGPKETTAYLGRAIVALASDPRVAEKSGQVVEVGSLAREYGFTDVDGSQPPPFRMPATPADASTPVTPKAQVLRFDGSVKRDPTVDAWMREHPGELGVIARRWFDVMRACGEDVRELLHDGHPTACVGDAAFGYVNAFTAHVNVGFFRGAELADPAALLEGSGKFMRHVKLRPGDAVDVEALAALVDAAYTDMKRRS